MQSVKLIEINNLAKVYRKIVLNNFSYDFYSRNLYVINSFNGSGKTTLVKLMLSLVKPTLGEVKLNSSKVCYIPDNIVLPDNLKVYDFIKLIFEYKNSKLDIDEILKEWEIEKYRKYKIKELSKGTMQKVGLICNLYCESDIYIFDEIFNGLDRISQNRLLKIIDNLIASNKLVIVITHMLDLFKERKYTLISINE